MKHKDVEVVVVCYFFFFARFTSFRIVKANSFPFYECLVIWMTALVSLLFTSSLNKHGTSSFVAIRRPLPFPMSLCTGRK